MSRQLTLPIVTYPPQQPGQGQPYDPYQQFPNQPGANQPPPNQPPPNQPFPDSPFPADPQPPMSGPPMSAPPGGGFPVSGPPVSGPPTSGSPVSGGAGMPPYQSGFPVPGMPTPPPQKKRSPLPWLLALCGVLVVAIVVVSIIVIAKPGSHQASPSTSSSASASGGASPSPSAVPSPSEGAGVEGDKIVDSATNWEYTKAGSPWKDVALPVVTEIDNAVGQSIVLDTGSYATIELGELDSSFGYTGPSDLETIKSDVATAMLKKYYGEGAKPDSSKDHLDEKLTQYGHKAWLWAFDVKYTSSGSDYTEYVVMAVLDAGGGKAALFWGSVPDGHDTYKNDMIDAASSLTPAS